MHTWTVPCTVGSVYRPQCVRRPRVRGSAYFHGGRGALSASLEGLDYIARLRSHAMQSDRCRVAALYRLSSALCALECLRSFLHVLVRVRCMPKHGVRGGAGGAYCFEAMILSHHINHKNVYQC